MYNESRKRLFQNIFQNTQLFFWIDRRDDKAIINPHIQSGGAGVRTPVITFGLTILIFLPVKLRVIGLKTHNFNRRQTNGVVTRLRNK